MLKTGIAATITGAAAHFTHKWINRKFGNGWRQMVSHTLGVSITAPFFYSLLRVLGIDEKQARVIMLAFFGSFFWVGIGTLIGWTIESKDKKQRQ